MSPRKYGKMMARLFRGQVAAKLLLKRTQVFQLWEMLCLLGLCSNKSNSNSSLGERAAVSKKTSYTCFVCSSKKKSYFSKKRRNEES